jgi:hypothetical protein
MFTHRCAYRLEPVSSIALKMVPGALCLGLDHFTGNLRSRTRLPRDMGVTIRTCEMANVPDIRMWAPANLLRTCTICWCNIDVGVRENVSPGATAAGRPGEPQSSSDPEKKGPLCFPQRYTRASPSYVARKTSMLSITSMSRVSAASTSLASCKIASPG